MTEQEKNIKKPRLTLVGAGYGDPDLITLKAIKALRNADVVLYDALANEELLEYCHPLCEKIFVGKKGHQSGISQDSINFLIVEKAYEKGHVVRLKGGDPFVFGRGREEIDFAEYRGVKCDYIPGISSVFSLGQFNIPLTSRDSSDGFWVMTGHKSDGRFSDDLKFAAQSNATLVFLMAMSKLEVIKKAFLDENKNKLPFCIIQNAGMPNQKLISGKISEISTLAKRNHMTNPAIILVGEVARYAQFSKNEICHKTQDFMINI